MVDVKILIFIHFISLCSVQTGTERQMKSATRVEAADAQAGPSWDNQQVQWIKQISRYVSSAVGHRGQ